MSMAIPLAASGVLQRRGDGESLAFSHVGEPADGVSNTLKHHGRVG